MSTWTIHHGSYLDVLNDKYDVCISDLPFTTRTVKGFRSGGKKKPKGITQYDAWTKVDFAIFAKWCVEHVIHRACLFNDHIGVRWLEEAFEELGWFVPPPVPWFKKGAPPKMNGMDPDPDVEYILMPRPRYDMPEERKGNREGFYWTPIMGGSDKRKKVVGQKPPELIRAITRDWSLIGDTVVDPTAGSGQHLAAFLVESRVAFGAEIDKSRYDAARELLLGGVSPSLWTSETGSRNAYAASREGELGRVSVIKAKALEMTLPVSAEAVAALAGPPHRSFVTPCIDPEKMHGAADGFGGSD